MFTNLVRRGFPNNISVFKIKRVGKLFAVKMRGKNNTTTVVNPLCLSEQLNPVYEVWEIIFN